MTTISSGQIAFRCETLDGPHEIDDNDDYEVG